MGRKKTSGKNRRPGTVVFMVLSLLPALCLATVLMLPPLVEFAVNRILKHSAARGYIICDISQITLFSANASVLARQKTPSGRFRSVLSLPHCRISYTPSGLLRGRIDGITVTGATIPASWGEEGITFPLAEIFKSVQQEKPERAKTENSPFAMVPELGFIRIENGALSLRLGRRTLYIPATLTLRQEGGWKKLSLRGQIHLNGQTITIRKAVIDTERGKLLLSLRLRGASLGNLPYPLDLYAAAAKAQGEMSAGIVADVDYGVGVVRRLESRLQIRNFSALAGGRKLSSERFAAQLDFDGKRGTLTLENLDVDGLFRLESTATEFQLSGTALSGRSSLAVKTPDPARFDFVFSASADPKQKHAQLSLHTAGEKPHELSWNGVTATLGSLAVALHAAPEQQCARVELKGIEAEWAGKKASAEKLALDLRHKAGVLSGELSGRILRAEDAASRISAADLVFSLPFRRGGDAAGKLSVGTISWRQRSLARLEADAELHLSDNFQQFRAGISGTAVFPDYPGVKLDFHSENGCDRGVCFSQNSFALPETEIPDVNLREFSEALAGIKLSGRIMASGRYEISRPGHSGGTVKVSLSGASVTDPSHELSVEGLHLDFELPALPALRSSPGLTAGAERIRLGGIDIGKTTVFYRMESPTVWAVEAVKANWVSGVVRMEFSRFDLAKDSFEVVLHCDRLNLSEILRQLGQQAAAGEGTLNGTIPVTVSPGNVTFHDGFLDSTPGETGTLRLSGTEYLTAGIPENVPPYVQLKFSQDVLKDLIYDWARLYITSRDDVLTLQMKISGRPAHPLPYRYDGGELVQVDTLTSFSGVRLDVNFNLSLANILNIIRNVKKISGGAL